MLSPRSRPLVLAAVIFLAPWVANGQGQEPVTPDPIPPAVTTSVDVVRHGSRMTVEAEFVLPAATPAAVPVAWRAFAGSRAARTLVAEAHGVRYVPVEGTTARFTATARIGDGMDRSGGFCVAPDLGAVGLAPVEAACMTGPRARRGDLTAHVPEFTVFGDSVASAFDWVPGTKEVVAAGLSARFDLRTCRRLIAAPCPPNPPSALSTIRSMPGSLGDIVVMDVGYNDWGASYDVPRVLRALRARGVKRVVWVLLRPTQGSYVSINAQIQRAARRSKDVQVADWGRAASGSWFGPDGVHLTPSGGWGLARFMRREVRQAVAALRQPAR